VFINYIIWTQSTGNFPNKYPGGVLSIAASKEIARGFNPIVWAVIFLSNTWGWKY
jgi:hypothetical protein